MPWTLQRYIFFEMGKTFLLAAAGLTAVLGLGGGVLNVVHLGEATPGLFFRLMLLLLPLAAALTMPLAVLFSAASTYGRLSADNEFVACRSSGINIHILFLPAFVLSLVAATVTFICLNLVVPGMVMNLDHLVRSDIRTVFEQRLKRSRGVSLGKYRIFADDTSITADNENMLVLERVAFVETRGESWKRFGTARQVRLLFDREGPRLSLQGELIGLRDFDPETRQYIFLQRQPIGKTTLPQKLVMKLKFLNLQELLYYWDHPSEWREVRETFEKLRLVTASTTALNAIHDDWLGDHFIELTDGKVRLSIEAEAASQTPAEGYIELEGVSITETHPDHVRTIKAKEAVISTVFTGEVEETLLQLEVYDASLSDGTTTLEKSKDNLAPLKLPREVVEHVATLTDADLLDESTVSGSLPKSFEKVRQIAGRSVSQAVCEIATVIHERLVFSLSVCFLVVLGAALGIVLRGSHVLIALGISFVPMLVVIITIVTGKQLAHNAGTTMQGFVLMWTGLIAVGILDIYTMTRVLRR